MFIHFNYLVTKKLKIKEFIIHLGDYIYWDDEKQTEFIKKEYGWKETEMEGTYKRYKSVECIMAGVHDFACYLKGDLDAQLGKEQLMLEMVYLLRKRLLG